ncbi:MAG: redoxin domain-containing protein [Bacteroidales bacterium]|nr:redoxin domain-containing protein [Bacteroidales bacterium]
MTDISVCPGKTGSWFAVLSIFIISLLFTFHPINIFADPTIKIGGNIPDFELEGADGKQYKLEQMKGKIIILVMGSRKTEENNEKWIEMLQQTFPESDGINIFSVMDMRIPFFISDDFVRGKIEEMQAEESVTLLMDWDQKVNELLGADKDQTDIIVISREGVLIDHQVGDFSQEKLENLVRELNANL